MPDDNANEASPEQSGLDINATSVFFKKDTGSGAGGMSSSLEAPSLFCKHFSNGVWAVKNFLPGKSFLKIGTSSSDCDLAVPQTPGISRVHIGLRLVLNYWFVLEHAPERAIMINGTKRPQAILRNGEACLITIGDTQIALKSVMKSSDKEAKTQTGSFDPLKPILYFKTKDREHKLAIDSSALIGSDTECRIQAPELPPIAGIVFGYHGKAYLHAAKSGAALTVDGHDATLAPRELTEGSVIAQGQHAIFTLAIRPQPENQQGHLPADFKGNLALLDISDNRFGAKLILPPAGRSLMIGRDASNHFMLDSLNVSKKHAQLIIYDNSVLILDAHSTNGTFIEDEQIAKKLLHPGEIVRFADKRFLLCHSE